MTKPATSPYTPTQATSVGFLVFFGLLAAVAGLTFATQATLGVALLAFALFLAVCGRIAQAGHQHKDVMRALEASHPNRPTAI